MRGFPKQIATKEDYLNLIEDGYDVREQLQALLSTAKIPVDVQIYPKGYGEPEYLGESLEPVWEEQTNERGKIFRVGATVKEAEALLAKEEEKFS